MTNHAPIDQPILEILNTYNPLEIKDILLHGARRKATNHKAWDDVLAIELKIRKENLGVIDGGKS